MLSSFPFWQVDVVLELSEESVASMTTAKQLATVTNFDHTEWLVEETMNVANCRSVSDLLTGYS